MKKELTSLEIRFLVRELQSLVDSKIDQIYQPNHEELLLQLHVTGTGKKLLRIMLPSVIFLTKEKPEMPKQILPFAEFLREFLNNSRIRTVKQVKNERIIEIIAEKERKYSLFIELFSKGNIILTYEDTILMALKVQKWKNRTIKKGKKYLAPVNKYDILGDKSFNKAIRNSEETISKILAVKLGLGRTYAEELCARAGVDTLNTQISYEKIEKIYRKLEKMINQPANPRIIYENNEVIDIVPVELRKYAKNKFKEFKTYNEALAFVLDKQALTKRKEKALQKFTRQLERIETKIEKQKQTLAKLERESVENQRKGELIYEDYPKIKESISGKKRQKIKINIG